MAFQQQEDDEDEEVGPQHADVAATAWAVGGAQQTALDAWATRFSWKTGMLPKVWKCSQAMPCGSVIQCLSLWA